MLNFSLSFGICTNLELTSNQTSKNVIADADAGKIEEKRGDGASSEEN